jgi:hypothetical protein
VSRVTLVSFDIDGTLEIGDPPGIITVAAVRTARRLAISSAPARTGRSPTSASCGNGWR